MNETDFKLLVLIELICVKKKFTRFIAVLKIVQLFKFICLVDLGTNVLGKLDLILFFVI